MTRSQISRTLRGTEARARIASILEREKFDSRSAFGRRICREFSFYPTTGRPRLAGCMRALAEIGRDTGEFASPPPRATSVRRGPRLLDGPVPEPSGVPDHPSGIRGPGP